MDRGRVIGLETGPDAGSRPRDEAAAQIVVSGVPDFAALEVKWRDLETRSDNSFFQSWTWTGCLVEERFPDPILVEAREHGRTVALALFNRRGRTLYLGESGDNALDGVFIEFNGVLTETGHEARLTAACLGAARARSGSRRRRLVLSGVNSLTAVSAAEIGSVRSNRSLAAPYVDLRTSNGRFLETRSANTRQQLRRSLRDYAATGAVAIERADTLPRAYEFLDGLAALHQTSWTAREQPGAFANPFFVRFHRALIAHGLGRGEIDLLRVTAGDQVIGLLYNFRYRGHSLAYQSGFDYAGATRHQKPGLTCHHEAIEFAVRSGATRYDFLAGDDRYKRSLSDQAEVLHWIEVDNLFSSRFLVGRLKDLIKGRRGAAGKRTIWPSATRCPDA
jgi:CelD/BcsL family acetyltransferase involved in cellulose biosynthesis